jgi:hypothetical protein
MKDIMHIMHEIIEWAKPYLGRTIDGYGPTPIYIHPLIWKGCVGSLSFSPNFFTPFHLSLAINKRIKRRFAY